MKNVLVSVLSLSLLSACSTIVNHQTQHVTVKTPGASNAKCYIENQDMKYLAYTDQKVEIMKSPHDLVVRCLAPGNREQVVHVKRGVNDWVVANVANGFVLGAAYDYFSRGAFDYPETITVSFIGDPVKQYPLPQYMSDDLKQNHQYSTIEYIGPGEMITEANKRDTTSPLKKKDSPFIQSTRMTDEPSSGSVDKIHSQYNPAVSYDPTEEDK